MDKKPIINWSFFDLILVMMLITLGSFVLTSMSSIGVQQLQLIKEVKFLTDALGQYILTVLVVFAVAQIKYPGDNLFLLLGLKRQPWTLKLGLQGIFIGCGLAFFAYGAELLLNGMFAHSLPVQPIAEALSRDSQPGIFLLILVLVSVIIGPVAEEILFRGFAYPFFENRFTRVAAIWLNGAFFGLAHFDMYRWVPLSLAGMCLTWAFQRTASLEVCILAHAVWNGIMVILVYFS